MQIKVVDKIIFLENILEEWKDIFDKEYNDFGNLGILKGLYIDELFIGGIWFGYNLDYFESQEGKDIISKLNQENYTKISYFFIKQEFRGKGYSKKFLINILEKNKKYFLTCSSKKLRKYYESIGFDIVYKEGEKYILKLN